jgi:hypothetical protein
MMHTDRMTSVTRIFLGAIAITVTLTCTTGANEAQSKQCEATVFVLQDLENEPSIPSPNGHYRVVLGVRSENDDHGWIRVYAGPTLKGEFELHDLSGGVFFNWSPDSRAFYVMWSNGGSIGGYSVRAFRVGGVQVAEVPLTKIAEREFEQKHPCPDRGHNVYAVRWSKGSEQLLLALQVYPTSDCGKELGLYSGYLVRVADGAILRRYAERELKSIWPVGCPSNVYPVGFWGTDDLKKAQEELRARQSKKALNR